MICAFVLYWSMASWSLRERGASRSVRIARAVPWQGPTYENNNLSNAAARSAFPLWTKIAAVRGSSMCAFCRNMSLTLPRASRTDMSTSKSVRTVGTCVQINVLILGRRGATFNSDGAVALGTGWHVAAAVAKERQGCPRQACGRLLEGAQGHFRRRRIACNAPASLRAAPLQSALYFCTAGTLSPVPYLRYRR